MCVLLLGGWEAVTAGAKVYCVAPATGCGDGTQSSLQAALTRVSADGAAGRIVLGAATYTSPASGFGYSGTVPMEIDGVSSSATTLTLPAAVNGHFLLASISSGALTVRSLRLLLPSASTYDGGLDVVGPATIAGVVVDGSAAATPGDGVELEGGGSVSETAVELAARGNQSALRIGGAAATAVQDSTFAAVRGIAANGPGLVEVHRCVLTGTSAASDGSALAVLGGSVSADDSLLRAVGTSAASASGLLVFASAASTTNGASTMSAASTMNAAQLTIVGNASDELVVVEAPSSGTATLHFSDSIVADPANGAVFVERGGSGQASVTSDYSDYDPALARAVDGATFTRGAHDTPGYVVPGFADPAAGADPAAVGAGDFHLLASSPLLNLDATPLGATPVGATESASDLDGNARITGGGRDLGAYQHQPPNRPPAVTAAATTSSPLPSGEAPSETILWLTLELPSLTPMGPVPDITGASESHWRWRAGNGLAGIAREERGAPVGTTFSFDLNEPAAVRLAFTGRVSGRRAGKSCAAESGQRRSRHRCAAGVSTASMSFMGHAGVNRIAFAGRASPTQELRPGRYVLVIGARSAGGQSAPRSLTFTILGSQPA